MLWRIMPYSLVTVQIPSRSAGAPILAPTRVKRKLLCSRGSPHQQHSLARAIFVSCHEADLLFFPSQSLCRDGYISGNILFLPGEHLLSSPSHAALSGLFIGQRQEGNVAHLNELNAPQPMQMRQIWQANIETGHSAAISIDWLGHAGLLMGSGHQKGSIKDPDWSELSIWSGASCILQLLLSVGVMHDTKPCRKSWPTWDVSVVLIKGHGRNVAVCLLMSMQAAP